MKKLNAEQIKKALECCIEGECDGCTYDEQTACKEYLLHDVLALVKELTEENERLRAERRLRGLKRDQRGQKK